MSAPTPSRRCASHHQANAVFAAGLGQLRRRGRLARAWGVTPRRTSPRSRRCSFGAGPLRKPSGPHGGSTPPARAKSTVVLGLRQPQCPVASERPAAKEPNGRRRAGAQAARCCPIPREDSKSRPSHGDHPCWREIRASVVIMIYFKADTSRFLNSPRTPT